MPDNIFTIGGMSDDQRDEECKDGILAGRDPDTLRLTEMRRSSGCVPGHWGGWCYVRDCNGKMHKTINGRIYDD